MNQRLKEMDVQFIDQGADGSKDFGNVKDGEVVILPAFGASVQEMRLLNDRNVQIVDTTCPWVRCACVQFRRHVWWLGMRRASS